MVQLRSAVALVGRFPALAGVDLDVSDSQIVLLSGHNGAGKSTLLRLCAGLVPLASGSAVVLGNDLGKSRSAVRRRVGLLGHETFLYEDLTVRENLDFWSRAAGATKEDGLSALDRLGVASRLHDVNVRGLSAGQRRRVSFAAMICRRPELWLLDEPHAGLDAAGRDTVDSLVTEAAAHGATVLFVSHELDRADALADRHLVIDSGIIVDETRRADTSTTDSDSVPLGAIPDA
ncbi:MAG: heme ABC exporter ATP-binding protein CcmA [Microthrixaceae bacterium]|nr:heme ABC exporter ATP-binding protein CcmA [Microthrixaceae bacterium]